MAVRACNLVAGTQALGYPELEEEAVDLAATEAWFWTLWEVFNLELGAAVVQMAEPGAHAVRGGLGVQEPLSIQALEEEAVPVEVSRTQTPHSMGEMALAVGGLELRFLSVLPL